MFSFAMCWKTKVCGDLERAFFTGQPVSRVSLLWQPRSGMPSLKPSDRLLARVSVHGMQDAEHRFCQKFHRTLLGGGVRENQVLQAVCTLTLDGKLLGIIGPHVGALLYAYDGLVGQGVTDYIKQRLVLSKESECNYSFCSRDAQLAVEKEIPCILLARRRTGKSVRSASRAATCT